MASISTDTGYVDPKLRRNVFALGLTSMVATFGNLTWTYFLPIYFEKNFGVSTAVVGLIYTAWLLMIGVGAAPAGALADRYGRKPILTLAGLISAIAVFALAFSHSFLLSAIAFPFTGLGTAFLSVSNVIVAESVEKGKRGSAFGTFQMLTYILPSISPLIGGISLLNNSSYFFPLFIFGGLAALAATVGRILYVRETLPKENAVPNSATNETKLKRNYYADIMNILKNRTLLALILAYSLYDLFVSQGSYIIPTYGYYVLTLNERTLGILFTAILLISALARSPYGKLSDRIGTRKTIAISWIGESLSVYVFVFAPANDLPVALIGIAMWSMLGVMSGPAVTAWLANVTDAKSRGLSMGTFYSAAFLISVPFFSLSGFLYDIHPQYPFYANSALSIAALIMLLALTRGTRKETSS